MSTVFCPTPPTWQQQLSPYKCIWEDILISKKQEVKTINLKGGQEEFYSKSAATFLRSLGNPCPWPFLGVILVFTPL